MMTNDHEYHLLLVEVAYSDVTQIGRRIQLMHGALRCSQKYVRFLQKKQQQWVSLPLLSSMKQQSPTLLSPIQDEETHLGYLKPHLQPHKIERYIQLLQLIQRFSTRAVVLIQRVWRAYKRPKCGVQDLAWDEHPPSTTSLGVMGAIQASPATRHFKGPSLVTSMTTMVPSKSAAVSGACSDRNNGMKMAVFSADEISSSSTTITATSSNGYKTQSHGKRGIHDMTNCIPHSNASVNDENKLPKKSSNKKSKWNADLHQPNTTTAGNSRGFIGRPPPLHVRNINVMDDGIKMSKGSAFAVGQNGMYDNSSQFVQNMESRQPWL